MHPKLGHPSHPVQNSSVSSTNVRVSTKWQRDKIESQMLLLLLLLLLCFLMLLVYTHRSHASLVDLD